MIRVAILPVPTLTGELSYHALAGGKRSQGRTVGAALDALTVQLDDDEQDTLVVVQHQKPDAFFSEVQQRRLAELMTLWRAARDTGSSLSSEDQAELDQLVEAELEASSKRAAAMLREMAG